MQNLTELASPRLWARYATTSFGHTYLLETTTREREATEWKLEQGLNYPEFVVEYKLELVEEVPTYYVEGEDD